MKQAQFRDDINGLRAWAVVAVVLYHFGVPGFGGGFVGVDVFFVISGFLMTGIITRALERGDFAVLAFYMARAKRIVPALVALCLALLVLGWLVLLPAEYKMLSTHSLYSMAFLSNVEYWLEAGYFDTASHEKWLLHTWSLSVEWQFYLLLPVLQWGVWRWRPGRAAQCAALAVAAALSLAACVLGSEAHPSAAFFLLHTRAWEMLAGGLVFLLAPQPGAAARRALELAGLALIALAVAGFDAQLAWPGWRAMVPVAGAMLVVGAARPSGWTGNRAAQWLGARSYSLYLWHWPVCVALVYTELRDEPAAIAAGLLLTLLLGHASYTWIEHSTRHLLGRVRVGSAALLLLGAVAAAAVPALAVRGGQGVAGRFTPRVELAAAEVNNLNPRRPACHADKGGSSPSCVYGGTAWKVIALGDSHVDAIVSSLAGAAGAHAADAGVVQWSYSGCPFVDGLKRVPASQAKLGRDYRCSDFIAWAGARLDALPADVPVVLVGRYAAAAFGRNEEREMDVPLVYFSTLYPRTTPQLLAEFSAHVTRTACQLARHRTVYLMRPIPEMGLDVPKTLSRRMNFGLQGDISVPLAEYQRRNGWVWAAQDAAVRQCGARILDPLPYLCRDGRCYGSRDGRPLYFDDDHLSEYGNKLLLPMFAQVYRAPGAAAPTKD